MSELEIFKKIVNFEKPDGYLPWLTWNFWPETKQEWVKEDGISPDLDLYEHLNLSHPNWIQCGLTATMLEFNPPFEYEVFEENDEELIFRNSSGIVCKTKKNNVSMPQWLSFSVTDEKSWEETKERLQFKNHNFGDNYDELCEYYKKTDKVNYIVCNGIYAFHRLLFGEVNLAYAYYDYPEVLLDMAEHWLNYYGAVIEKVIEDTRVDFVTFHEDMSFKNGPLLGPDMFKKHMKPFYEKMIAMIKSKGIEVIGIDTDGDCDELTPWFLDVGINMLFPWEQASGNDLLEIRKKYPKLIMWGGIDKRVLNQGIDEVREEIYKKVPQMWEIGGYIPSIDHSTPPCSFENFKYYRKCIEEICK